MIKSCKHRGLEKFYREDSKAGIIPAHAEKLRDQLSTLNLAKSPFDMDNRGWVLHPLRGKLKDHWSVRVNANWRLTFRFENGDAEVLDYQDYH